MATSMVGRLYTHTSAQCSPASVGLTQAHPNNTKFLKGLDVCELHFLVEIIL